MRDWPECASDAARAKSKSDGTEGDGDGGGGVAAASTLEQLKGAPGGGGGAPEGGPDDGDGSSPGVPFTDDFVGTEVSKNYEAVSKYYPQKGLEKCRNFSMATGCCGSFVRLGGEEGCSARGRLCCCREQT